MLEGEQRRQRKLAGPRLDLAQGLNLEGKAVRKGKKRNSLTARAGHLQLPLPVNQERLSTAEIYPDGHGLSVTLIKRNGAAPVPRFSCRRDPGPHAMHRVGGLDHGDYGDYDAHR